MRSGRVPSYAHFIDCSFHLDDMAALASTEGMNNAVDGLVFRTRPGELPGTLAPAIRDLTAPRGLGACLSVRMSGPDPATHHGSRKGTAALVCDALDAAYAAPGRFDVVLDTLIDTDRGYFPRHGLLDRRYNHTEVSNALIE